MNANSPAAAPAAVTSSGAASYRAPGKPIASPWHTIVVLLIGAANAYRGLILAAQARAGVGPSRSQIYLRTMLFEVFFLAVVVVGIRLHRSSMTAVFGQRWQSAGEFFRDLGIGAALWLVALVLVAVLGILVGHHHQALDPAIVFLLPQSSGEMALWLALSAVAGICEEGIFRGYLQTQFTAFTGSVYFGIALSAAAFGAGHLYQGRSRALLIAGSAILFGFMAHWRRTVRPGMFAHAFQDAIAAISIRLLRH